MVFIKGFAFVKTPTLHFVKNQNTMKMIMDGDV